MPTPGLDTKPEADPCVVQARRIGAVREKVIGSIAVGREDVVFVAKTSDPGVLHRWYLAGPHVQGQAPVVEPIVLPSALQGFHVQRRIEFADPLALLFELVSPDSTRVLVEVFARGRKVRMHDAPKGEVLAAAGHPSGDLIHASVAEGDLHLVSPGARVTLHDGDPRSTRYSVNLEPFADGHLLAVTIVESHHDMFLLARLDVEGQIVWQRVLGRQPSSAGRRNANWPHDSIGAPVVASDAGRLVVAFGTRTIVVHALDPTTGGTLERGESETAHDEEGHNIPWIPLAVSLAPHHTRIIARSCVHGDHRCGLTSLKWTGGTTLPRPVLKVWFSDTSFPAVHDWTDRHEARLVLATNEWSSDTTNWWIIDLPDSCEEDREAGSVPYEVESRLPY